MKFVFIVPARSRILRVSLENETAGQGVFFLGLNSHNVNLNAFLPNWIPYGVCMAYPRGYPGNGLYGFLRRSHSSRIQTPTEILPARYRASGRAQNGPDSYRDQRIRAGGVLRARGPAKREAGLMFRGGARPGLVQCLLQTHFRSNTFSFEHLFDRTDVRMLIGTTTID